MRRWIAVLLLAGCGATYAQDGNVLDANITKFLQEDGLLTDVVMRVDGDLTGDGVLDTVIGRSDDHQQAYEFTVLYQLHGKALQGDGLMQGLDSIDGLQLQYGGMGLPELSIKNKVLVVKHMVGGSQERTETTYRYRFDGDESRMRLIGMDVERGSNSGAAKLSWNVLTGARTLRTGTVGRYGPEIRMKVKPEMIHMDKTPDAEELLEAVLADSNKH